MTPLPHGLSGKVLSGSSLIASLVGAAGGEYVTIMFGMNSQLSLDPGVVNSTTNGPVLLVGRAATPGGAPTVHSWSGATWTGQSASHVTVPFFSAFGGISTASGSPNLGVFGSRCDVAAAMRIRCGATSLDSLAPVVEVSLEKSKVSGQFGVGGVAMFTTTYNDMDSADLNRYYGGTTVRTVEPQVYLRFPVGDGNAPGIRNIFLPPVRVFLPAGQTVTIEVGLSCLTDAVDRFPLSPYVEGRFSPKLPALLAYIGAHPHTKANTFNVWKTLVSFDPALARRAAQLYHQSQRASMMLAPVFQVASDLANFSAPILGPKAAVAGVVAGGAARATRAYGKTDGPGLLQDLVNSIGSAPNSKVRKRLRRRIRRLATELGVPIPRIAA